MYHCGYPQPQCPNELLQLMNEAVFGVAVPKKLQPCEHVCRPLLEGFGVVAFRQHRWQGWGWPWQAAATTGHAGVPVLFGKQGSHPEFPNCPFRADVCLSGACETSAFCEWRFCAEAEPCWWLSAQQRPFLFLFLEQRGWKRGK